MKYLPWKSQTNFSSEAKALQRRGIRVSEMFVKHRSSGDARLERSGGRYAPNRGCQRQLTGVEKSEIPFDRMFGTCADEKSPAI